MVVIFFSTCLHQLSFLGVEKTSNKMLIKIDTRMLTSLV